MERLGISWGIQSKQAKSFLITFIAKEIDILTISNVNSIWQFFISFDGWKRYTFIFFFRSTSLKYFPPKHFVFFLPFSQPFFKLLLIFGFLFSFQVSFNRFDWVWVFWATFLIVLTFKIYFLLGFLFGVMELRF